MSEDNIREFFDLNVTPNLEEERRREAILNRDFIPKTVIPDRIVETSESLSAVDLEIENLKKRIK
jgi:hypothetical protein